jgi:hypothetical protein
MNNLAVAVETNHTFSGNVTERELIDVAIRKLIDESKNEITDGYIHLRLREILGGSKWAYLLIPLQKIGESAMDARYKHARLIKFIYDCWLIISGLKVSKY